MTSHRDSQSLDAAVLLDSIYSRSLTLEEVIEQECWPTHLEGRISEWITEWKNRVAKGSDDLFARRLLWMGVEGGEAQLLKMRCGNAVDPTAATSRPCPPWVILLGKILKNSNSTQPKTHDSNRYRNVPFGPQLGWIAALFVDEFAHRMDSVSTGWSIDAVRSDIEALFVRQSSRFAATALYQRFDSLRTANEQCSSAQESFSAYLDEGGWREVLSEHPLLARSIAETATFTIDSLVEMLERLEADADRISQDLLDGRALGALVEIDGGLSDRHNNGRQVARLRFESGAVVFYKPKPVDLDAAYQLLVAALGDLSATPGAASVSDSAATGELLAAVPTLAREGYGWCAMVSAEALQDRHEVSRYYRRSGRLLALAYALEGRDFIMDNLIATRHGPLAIDCEALMQPLCLPAIGDIGDRNDYLNRLWELRDWSVLETGLLPRWQRTPDGRNYDVSGICGVDSYVSPMSSPVFENVNTDSMKLVMKASVIPPEKNCVYRSGSGTPVRAEAHADSLCEGFAEMFDLLAANPDVLSAPSVANAFDSAKVRLLYRSTSIYARLLHSALRLLGTPNATGLDKSLAFEGLCTGPLASPTPPRSWDLVNRELHALERWDVPYFLLSAADSDHPMVLCSALRAARRRLSELREQDKLRQLRLIRNSLRLRPVPDLGDASLEDFCGSVLQQLGNEIASQPTVSSDESASICRSESPSEQLAGSPPALRGQDKSASWVVDHSLYSGSIGRAVVLAALGNHFSDERFANESTRLLEEMLESAPEMWPKSDNLLGATSGVGGLAYGATLCSDLLSNEKYTAWAAELVTCFFSQSRLETARETDLSNGLAGAALSLSACHSASRGSCGDVFLTPALLAADRLVQIHQAQGSEATGDASPEYTGYAHGLAGTMSAFARVGALSGRRDLDQAAAECFERLSSHAPETPAEDWPVAWQPDGTLAFRKMDSWCHGSPGIVLAMTEFLASATQSTALQNRVKQLIEGQLRRLVQCPPKPNEDLCCGNTSRIEALLRCAEVTENDVLYEHAATLARAQLGRRDILGLFGLGTKPSETMLLTPGFFRGMGGVAYTLLRALSPRRYASVAAIQGTIS